MSLKIRTPINVAFESNKPVKSNYTILSESTITVLLNRQIYETIKLFNARGTILTKILNINNIYF